MRNLFNTYRDIFISKFNVSEERFNADFNEWVINRGMDVQSKNDFIWRIFNRLVFEAPSKDGNLYQNLRDVYGEMFGFLIKEKKSASHILRQIHYCDLALHEERNYVIEVVVHSSDCCPECNSIEGLKMTVEEALKKEIIPLRDCTRSKGCICFYGFRAKRDQNGTIVMK